ncbi:MAG: hypothetical protein PHF99_08990 [Bacteroidales bacterium]|nr:hypothetical protein [Bacteroidales bacterium]
MNEIAGIFFKTDELNLTNFSAKAVQFFKEKFAGLTAEYLEDNIILLSASKTNKKREIQEYNEHITALGGYLLNEPEATNLNKYEPGLFHGKFLFLHINKIERITKIYNDMLGHFPVFYYENHDLFCFSSDLSFLLSLDIDKTISKQHIADYFFWGSTLPGTTFFEKIKLLPPASEIVIDKNTVKFNNYTVENKSYDFKNINEAAETLTEVMRSVIKSYYDYYGKLNFTLTGGLDTRYIASLIDPDWDVEFVTVADRYVNDDENNDIIIAKEIAELLGIKHIIFNNDIYPKLNRYDIEYFYKKNLPIENRSLILGVFGSEILKMQAFLLVNPFLSKKIGFVDNDFCLLYPEYPTFKNAIFNKKKIPFLSLLKNNIKSDFKERSVSYFREIIVTSKINKLAPIVDIIARSYFSNFYGGHKSGNMQHHQLFSSFIMPFVDSEVLDVLSSFPMNYFGKEDGTIYSYLFSVLYPKLGQIPTNSDYLTVNSKIFAKSEKGINPLDNYVSEMSNLKDANEISFEYLDDVFISTRFLNYVKKSRWFNTAAYDFGVWIKYVNSFN